ncbi:DUF3606 domain-containing protein [Roseomonas sp. NAR14]|uniref:DUF3606 domain-containing protein n=1 Tax=Roseomonas acroporae TaxID=2937791 RepID=A0A9X2BST5_9PROT|nr:DUF3606 domain-containing protein [Roseomonas acroporae]MCK8783883.1 DUF3606 domain-containing protein [Roseomonas acroporae]
MSDDDDLPPPWDTSRIDMHDNRQVAYWAERWNVTPMQLEAAVDSVGDSTAAVARLLGKKAVP